MGEEGAWQLKLPGGPDRTEFEVRGSIQVVPAELSDLLTAIIRARELRPAATLVTQRRTMLAKAGGVIVAEVVHDEGERRA